ncbi:MAG: serine/threonine protein kinase [Planctomycetes bacterium]|nr:serine/threonine protein kinase [Planctomycetota bacterium]
MAFESEALLLRAGVRAGLLDPEKGTAALVVYHELKRKGVKFSFGDFLVHQGLISKIGLEGLEAQQAAQQPAQQSAPRPELPEDLPEAELAEIGEAGAAPAPAPAPTVSPGSSSRNPAVQTISQIGDYELLELLAEGESGSVFRARQVSTGTPCAVKILSPSLSTDNEALQRFLIEGRICKRLKHPHIVQVQHIALNKNLYYFVMELVEGGSARKLLYKAGGRLSEALALNLVSQVAGALAAAHRVGLVHRDVKPENILISKLGEAKLSDLGLATRSAVEPAGEEMTSEFWGTPQYLAPEVINGTATHDPSADIYALGATLFEFLAGRTPFLAETPAEMLQKHLHEHAPDVRELRPDISPLTARLVQRLLAKDPEQRFPDAETLVEAIRLIREQPVEAGGLPKMSGLRPGVGGAPAARSTPTAGLDRRDSPRRSNSDRRDRPERRSSRDRAGRDRSGPGRRAGGERRSSSDRRDPRNRRDSGRRGGRDSRGGRDRRR